MAIANVVVKNMENIDLASVESGKSCEVVSIIGGFGLVHRLARLGIKIGVKIKKISGQPMRGPVIVEIGNSQVAIGFGMARKIFVKLLNE